MKKILTMILSLALVLSMIPATASVAFAAATSLTEADVTMFPETTTYNGNQQKPTVTVKDGSLKENTDYTLNWGNGNYTDQGSYTVTISGKTTGTEENPGGYLGTITKTFTIQPLSINDSRVKIVANGTIADTYTSGAAVPLADSGLTFYFSNDGINYSSNTTIFNDANLEINVSDVNGGYATLTVKGKTNLKDVSSGTYRVQIVNGLDGKVDIAAATTPTYNGTSQKVNLKVTYKNSTTLVQGEDYIVSPERVTDVSQDAFQITGTGKYAGTVNKTVKYIQPKNVESTNGVKEVKVSQIGNQVRGTTASEIEVTVTDIINGRETNLTRGKDYTCTIDTNPAVGKKGTATIEFKGNYTGTRTQSFDVVDADADLSKATVTFTATGTKIYNTYAQAPNNIQVTLSGKTLTKDKDYTIKYRYTEDGKTTDVGSPVDAKVYKVVAIGKGSYGGEATSDATFEISKYPMRSVTVSVSMASTTAVPTVTVKSSDGKITFVRDKDYSMSYSTNKNTGKVNVIITPLTYGNLTGIASNKDYPITANKTDISKYTVILRETTVTADGTAKTPVITKVAYGSSTLSLSDYTVSYQDSTGKTVTRLIEPGTYKVVVTGKNGYSGSCYATYTILGLTQSITGIKNYYKVYPTTQPFKLDPQVAEKTGFTFTSSDPTVASVDAYGYVTMHKPGRAKITITTKGTVKYNQATTSTEIRVYPNKVTMSRNPWTTGKKGQIKVRWNKRVGATRYEIRYSRQKSFKKGSYKTKKAAAAVNSYSTQSTTVSGLRKGYTYYVKVRAVTQVYDDYGQKVNYYGNWSKAKTVKVK